MRNIKKKLFLFTMLVLIVATLSGCGGCGKKNKNTIDKNAIYREEDLNIKFAEGTEIERIFLSGDKIVYLSMEYGDDGYPETYWGTVELDGSNLTSYKIERNKESYQYVNNVKINDKGEILIYYVEYNYSFENDEYTSEENYWLAVYSEDGKCTNKIDMTDFASENGWIQSIESINGKTVFFMYDRAIVLNDNLEVDKVISDNYDNFDLLFRLKNGEYAIIVWDENGESLYKYDINSFKKGEKIDIPFSLYSFSLSEGGNSGYDFIATDSTKVYGFNIGDKELTTLINFVDSDIYTSSFILFEALASGQFISASTDWSEDTPVTRICKYTKVAPEDVVDKEIITLGALYIWDDVKKDVIDFNKKNPDYRITLIDYDSYCTEEDWDAGLKKFNSDISSGTGPDIILASDLSSLSAYSGKKLFVDLNDYLDKDPDIDKDDLFPNVLDACTTNGKLYALSPVFYVNTAAAKKSILNGKTSWTIQEMIEFEKSLPEGTRLFDVVTRYTVLSRILSTSGTSFINEKEASCNFNSAEFVALLEYVKTLPEDYEGDDIIYYEKMAAEDEYEDYYSKWRTNKVVLYETYLSDIRNYNYMLKGVFGEDISLIGYPSSDGNGSILEFNRVYAISAKSSNPDAAWEFVRQYFTKEAMDKVDYGFPISMSKFDELGKEAMQRPFYIDYDGTKVEYDDEYYFNGEYIPLSCITAEEVAELKEAIKSVNKSSNSFTDIITIIEEEAAYFFEGEKSAQDVADIIQSRVSILLKEKQ